MRQGILTEDDPQIFADFNGEERRGGSNLYTRFGKRLSDLLLSATAICVLSPLFWGSMIAILLDSRGGTFFYQKRVGQGFKPFRLIKFRSMRPVSGGAGFEPGDGRRVTRVGRILRKTKIDELPGLFNVLFGHMSLVGPRPEVPKYVEAFRDDYRDILSVRPGLSDLASIKYRDEEKILARQPDPETYYCQVILPDKIQLAKAYVRELSPTTDLSIIAETLRAVLGIGRRDRS